MGLKKLDWTVPQHCVSCHCLMHPRGRAIPGAVLHSTKGLCHNCYARNMYLVQAGELTRCDTCRDFMRTRDKRLADYPGTERQRTKTTCNTCITNPPETSTPRAPKPSLVRERQAFERRRRERGVPPMGKPLNSVQVVATATRTKGKRRTSVEREAIGNLRLRLAALGYRREALADFGSRNCAWRGSTCFAFTFVQPVSEVAS